MVSEYISFPILQFNETRGRLSFVQNVAKEICAMQEAAETKVTTKTGLCNIQQLSVERKIDIHFIITPN